jgi:hypothetical protein
MLPALLPSYSSRETAHGLADSSEKGSGFFRTVTDADSETLAKLLLSTLAGFRSIDVYG